jgi:hypothetical protein
VHFWTIAVDVVDKGLYGECEKQGGEWIPLLYSSGGFNNMWSNKLKGRAAICHLDVLEYAWALVDDFFKKAVSVDRVEGILEIQADDDKVGVILLVCY